jgi:hypothetical protein
MFIFLFNWEALARELSYRGAGLPAPIATAPRKVTLFALYSAFR